MSRDKKKQLYSEKEKTWLDKFVGIFSGDSVEDRYLKYLQANRNKKKKGK